MSWESERVALSSLYYDAVDNNTITKIETTQIGWEGQKFELPDTGIFTWFTIMNGEANQASMGGVTNRHRSTGIVQIDLYNREGEGTKALRELADEISAVFRQVSLTCSDGDNIKLYEPSLNQSSISYQRSSGMKDSVNRFILRIPFYRDSYI